MISITAQVRLGRARSPLPASAPCRIVGLRTRAGCYGQSRPGDTMIGVCGSPAPIPATLLPFALRVAVAQARTNYPAHPGGLIVPDAARRPYDLDPRPLAGPLSTRTAPRF